MGALFKFLLIVLLIYLFLRWLLKPIFRMVMAHFLKKLADKNGVHYREFRYSSQAGGDSRSNDRRQDGNVRVDFVPPRKNSGKISDNDGEYVDFEEVK